MENPTIIGDATLYFGDCLEALKQLPDNSVDTVITDPPAGIGFMNRPWDIYNTDLPSADFLNWFAGFVDGEGCFSIHKKPQSTYDCQFSISLRADDRPVLVEIQKTLGIGTISSATAHRGSYGKPQVRFVVSSKSDCLKLVSVLRAAPLRAKKAIDFETWVAGLISWVDHVPNEWADMLNARERLMSKREFSEYGKVAGPPNRRAFIADKVVIFKECLRVAKPGATLLCWSIPRTSHWTGTAIENAGWEVRDVITHLFGQGYPKSMDINKQLSKTSNADSADDWLGYGTALKPAAEFWWLAMKPLDGNFVENAKRWGVAGLNIDGARVAHNEKCRPMKARIDKNGMRLANSKFNRSRRWEDTTELKPSGRFPANVILSHSPDCELIGTHKVKNRSGNVSGNEPSHPQKNVYQNKSKRKKFRKHGDAEGNEEAEIWKCVPDCPVAMLDAQSGYSGMHRNKKTSVAQRGNVLSGTFQTDRGARGGHTDDGGASRFFYVAKASRQERELGLEDLPIRDIAYSEYRENYGDTQSFVSKYPDGTPRPMNKSRNFHPTVKSIALMRYLCRLTRTPSGGTVLDPFMGTGTTGIAALLEKRKFIGIENKEEYFPLAIKRIAAWSSQLHLPLE